MDAFVAASLAAMALISLILGVRHVLTPDDVVVVRLPSHRVAAEEQSGSRLSDQLDSHFSNAKYSSGLALALTRADVKLRVSEFLAINLGLVMTGLLIGWLITGSPISGVILALVGGLLPHFWLQRRTEKRFRLFQEQLPDVLTLMVSSLRAGYGMGQALNLITQEMPSPSKEEYGRVSQELALGYSLRDSLNRLVTRTGSEDLELVVTAINVQHEVGGNLGEILETIAATVRERMRIKGEIKVMTSSQMTTGYMLAAMPVIIAGVLMFINPRYMNPVLHFPWILIPGGALVNICLGLFVIKRMIKTDF